MCAAVDVHYLRTGGARAAGVLAADADFVHMLAERTGAASRCRPTGSDSSTGASCRRYARSLDDLSGLGPLVVGGYAGQVPPGRPGLGAQAQAEFGIAVIGVAKSRFRTAAHAVPVLRGSSARPLFVTAARMPAAHAPYLARRMAGRTGCPAPCAVPAPSRGRSPAATMTERQPGRPTHARNAARWGHSP